METAEKLIYIDDLTGFYNRRYLYSHLPQELDAAAAENYNLWLYMLDIDNFKNINDTYGHLSGDDVIKEVGEIIKENTKADDKKIRYAGDEFTIILPRVENKDVIPMAERLLEKIRQHIFKDKRTGKEIKLTMSLGIAGFPQDTSGPIELINLADKSLYLSKQKGKDCVSTTSEITPELFWKKDLLDRFPCSVFFERQAELSQLKAGLEKARAAEGQFILITGDLGMGKSRLLVEFENFVAGSGQAVCLVVHCEEKLAAQFYYALGEVLYKYITRLDRLPENILEAVTEQEQVALFNFMPKLKDMLGAPPALKEAPSEEKRILADGLIKLLVNISRVKPLCLIFDDFHYIDPQTLGIILRFMQENQNAPILTLATFSSRELATPEMASSALASVVNTEMFQKSSQMITLSGLSPQGTEGMINTIFSGVSLSAGLTDLITKTTQGNPLFVEELLKYLIEKEYVIYDKDKWVEKALSEADIPSSIEETIKRRLEGLSEETKEMIAKAAVIGDNFQVDLLQKIDSEDKGYVLDLIEAAKKIGLVYEKGPGEKDEFSFVTGEIRKVLFGAIGNNRVKNLHSRLGQIKEQLYPDKLDNIAGELYYNFKKAEDWVRAEQYAKVIKEGKSTFYDSTLRYAQSLLQEVEEEKLAIPLSKKAMALIPEIIKYLYLASVNYILYPPHSSMRLQVLGELEKRLNQIFPEVDILMLACVQDAVIVNEKKLGKEVKNVFSDGFISLFKNLNIESLTLEKGVTQEELSKFIEVINSPESKETGFTGMLEEAGVTHIRINEVSYDLSRRHSKEKESLQEIMLIDYILGKMPSTGKEGDLGQGLATHAQDIAQALEKLSEQASRETGKDKEKVKAELMTKSIQKIGSQFLKEGTEGWAKYKEGLAKTILSMEPNLRANIFGEQADAGAGAGGEKEKDKIDIIKEISHDIPDDIATDVLLKQFQQKDTNIEKMRNLTQRFLSTPEKKQKLVPVLRQKLQQLGATQDECDWMLAQENWNALAQEEKLKRILTLPLQDILKLLPLMKVEAITRELLAEEKDTQVEAVMERCFNLFIEGYPESKNLTAALNRLLNLFIENSRQKFFPKFIQRLNKVAEGKDSQFCTVLLSVINPSLEKALKILLEDNRLGLIKEVIQCYTRDAKTMQESSRALDPVALQLAQELIRRIDNHLDWQEIAEVLVLFKEKAARPLIEEALFEKGVESGKYFEAYLRRLSLGKILGRMVVPQALSILKEKFSDPHPYIVKNLIELIGAMENDEATRLLEAPLKHKDIAVRRKAIFLLGKTKGKVSAQLLGAALKDTEASLRKDALNFLKNRNDGFSIEVLKERSQGKDLPEDIQQGIAAILKPEEKD